MRGYLLDTSVLSATAPDKGPPPLRFSEWLIAHEDHLHVSVVTIAEVEQGIELLRQAGVVRRVKILSDWLDRAIELFGPRVLSLTPALAHVTGRVSAKAISIGRHPGFPDVVIAATAKEHALTVLTRNIKHFEPLGVPLLDPFEPSE